MEKLAEALRWGFSAKTTMSDQNEYNAVARTGAATSTSSSSRASHGAPSRRRAGISSRTSSRSLSPEHRRVVGLEEAAVRRVADLQASTTPCCRRVADLRAEHRKLSEAVARFDARVRDALQAHEARKAGAAA